MTVFTAVMTVSLTKEKSSLSAFSNVLMESSDMESFTSDVNLSFTDLTIDFSDGDLLLSSDDFFTSLILSNIDDTRSIRLSVYSFFNVY